ncbi:MAG: HAMP domain-containing histidine kinase [Clostridiales bacterium]|nr:HAMP domain-containing histidine kinase [Clostridiales bacterium]
MKREHLTIHFAVFAFIFLMLMSTGGFMIFSIVFIRSLYPTVFLRAVPIAMFLIAIGGSVILGTLISILVSRYLLRPVDDLITAIKKVAQGDFSVRVKEGYSANELNQLRKSFNNMAEDLSNTELFRNDFINNFSHEFKTPIVSIRGFAKQLQNDNISEEQKKEYVDIIVNESDRLASMSSNILLLSKFENQQIVTDKTTFYLDEQIRGSILLLEKQWSAKNLELDIDMDEVSYYSNEEMMSHIWLNILSNAVKFTPENGKITVKCKKSPSGEVTVKISDNGIGMDDRTQKHIFDKFYQGDSSHARAGNGLGLSLAKRVTDLCGGKISVKSQPNKGTTFTIRLPAENPDEI